jgi:hypothetical protein
VFSMLGSVGLGFIELGDSEKSLLSRWNFGSDCSRTQYKTTSGLATAIVYFRCQSPSGRRRLLLSVVRMGCWLMMDDRTPFHICFRIFPSSILATFDMDIAILISDILPPDVTLALVSLKSLTLKIRV